MRSSISFLFAAAQLAIVAPCLVAQVAAGARMPGAETRAELRQLLVEEQGSSDPQRGAAARAIAERLRAGDFQPGDRILVTITGDQVRSDTLTVRAGRTLELPGLTEVSLVGVLRSELRAHLDSAVARFLKDARVEATPLVRLAITGEVMRPGFYSFPSDAALSDAIMAAGGLASTAELSRSMIRRDGRLLQDPEEVRTLLARGATLYQAGIRPGDELVIGRRRDGPSQAMILAWVTALSGVTALVLTQRH